MSVCIFNKKVSDHSCTLNEFQFIIALFNFRVQKKQEPYKSDDLLHTFEGTILLGTCF